jgi:hypothetical protein
LAWLGLAWLGLAWLGLAWLGLAWLGLAWLSRSRSSRGGELAARVVGARFEEGFADTTCGTLVIGRFNQTGIDDEKKEIVYYQDVDISIAVATPKGLVTPVLRDCDRMSFADIEKEIAALGAKARDNKVGAAQGGRRTMCDGRFDTMQHAASTVHWLTEY